MIKVYARTDGAGRVLEIASSIFLRDPDGWVLIGQGEGDRFAHAQANYLDRPLNDEDGTHNYRLDGGVIREATEEERAEEKASFPTPRPSQEEQILALQSQLDALLGVE